MSHLLGVCGALSELGLSVHFLGPAGSAELSERVATSYVIPGGRMGWLRRTVWGWRLVVQLRQLVRSRRYALVYMRYSAGASLWTRLIVRLCSGVPVVVEVNSLASPRCPVLRAIHRVGLAPATTILCVSDTVRQAVAEVAPARRHQCVVIPNGVETRRFGVSELPSGGGGACIGYVGSLKPDYGLEDLCLAVRRLSQRYPNICLEIYGEGPYRERLRQIAGVSVRLRPPVPFDSVPALLSQFEVLVAPASPATAFQSPIKLYEYMAAGCPIVAADTPANRLTLRDGRLGTLYGPGDIEDLQRALRKVLDNPGHAASMAASAKAEVFELHDWTARMSQLLTLLELKEVQ